MLTCLLIATVIAQITGRTMRLSDEQRDMSRNMLPGAAVLVALALMIAAFYLGAYVAPSSEVIVPDYSERDGVYMEEISELKDSIATHRQRYDELTRSISESALDRNRRGSVVSDRVRTVGLSVGDSGALSRYLQVAARNYDRPLHETPREFLYESGAFETSPR